MHQYTLDNVTKSHTSVCGSKTPTAHQSVIKFQHQQNHHIQLVPL